MAETAAIISNATCGERNSEVYCQLDLLGNVPPSNQECGICDATERGKAHPIGKAIDGQEGTWWQAPSLQFGPDYHFVTITVDLKKVFQVGYILMQSGISPRPGNWILERSLDGVEWAPWQFFAVSDEECWRAFGVEPRRGKPSYRYDDEVICTSYFSALDPVQNGEIHVSLVNGRPGASGPSRTLTEFTLARYIRIRFRRLRILPQDQSLVQGLSYPDTSVLRRYFYSLQDLTIGGQCPCNGHAGECKVNHHTMVSKTGFILFKMAAWLRQRKHQVLVGATISWLAWCTLLLTYIPFVLCYLPPDGGYCSLSPGDATSSSSSEQTMSLEKYYLSGQVSAIIILFAILVDSNLLAGVYLPTRVAHELLLFWMSYYLFIIPALMVGGGWIAWTMADIQGKCWSILPFSVGIAYSCLWMGVYRLYRETINAQSLIMTKLADIALQPLAEKFMN